MLVEVFSGYSQGNILSDDHTSSAGMGKVQKKTLTGQGSCSCSSSLLKRCCDYEAMIMR